MSTRLQAVGKTAEGKTVTTTILDDVSAEMNAGQLNAIAGALQPLVTYPIKTMRLVTTTDIETEFDSSITPGIDYFSSDDTLRITYVAGDAKQTRSYSNCATPQDTTVQSMGSYKDKVTALANAISEQIGIVMTTATIRSTTDYKVDPNDE